MGFFLATPLNKQQGSALVFAMGLSLLVVALSAALLLTLSLDIRRVEQLIYTSERLGLLESTEAMAAEKIKSLPQDWEEPWEMTLGETKISAKLEDLSARINMNTVFAPIESADPEASFQAKSVLLRLLKTMEVPNAEEFLDDFHASGTRVFGIGQLPALELAAPYLYAAESSIQAINLNTTTPEVLASLLDIPLQQASAILLDKPFESVKAFTDKLSDLNIEYNPQAQLEAWLGIDGQYYLLETTITQKRSVRIYSVFQKSDKTVRLEWRSWEKMP
jgi:type II secretory pathway component PulK